MDFFARQDCARQKTCVLTIYFIIAVIAVVFSVYFVLTGIFGIILLLESPDTYNEVFRWWNPHIFTGVTMFVSLLVFGGSLAEVISLRYGGGAKVAEMMGGRQLAPNAADPDERQLLNVVEEMAIASGVPAPPVYVMDSEEGINAFAAGYRPSDAVIAVTRGLIEFLDRDETQGVVAHEFSHILNGDMRLNIHLMGTLHGILMIHMIGKTMLRGIRHARRGGIYLILVGGALAGVGYIGVLFGSLIKSAISRQREFLADASSVQFTRNPAGLSGALQKIGGLSTGSIMWSSRAEDASHMFFGNAFKAELASLATHPPLHERIRRIDPRFDGTLPKLESIHSREIKEAARQREDALVASIRENLEDARTGGSSGSAVAGSLSRTSNLATTPEAVIKAIGTPMQEHFLMAQVLLSELPDQIRNTAREPFGARAIVYALLMDKDDEIRNWQLEKLEESADRDVFHETKRLLPALCNLKNEAVLPLVDIAVPALKTLSLQQYRDFKANLEILIAADEEIDLFEFTLMHSLVRNLDAVFLGPANRIAHVYGIRGVAYECSALLSMLARIGHETEEQAEKAFRFAAKHLEARKTRIQLMEPEECSLATVGKALEAVAVASPKVKKWVVAACLQCLVYDKKITQEETELFRAISYALECPVSPMLSDATR